MSAIDRSTAKMSSSSLAAVAGSNMALLVSVPAGNSFFIFHFSFFLSIMKGFGPG